MEVNDILSAIVIGAVIGTLGRLALPGRQNIGVFVTLLIGIGASVLGTFVVRQVNIVRLPEELWVLTWDWVVLGIQIGVAAIGTALAALITRSRLNTDVASKKRVRAKRTRARA